MLYKPAAFLSALTLALTQATALTQSSDGVYLAGGEFLLAETVADELNRPWGLAFLPNGDLLLTEKNGGFWRLRGGRGPAVQVLGLPDDLDQRLDSPIDNSGLFDVAVDPEFPSNQRIFLSYASAGPGGSALKVSSFRLAADRLVNRKDLILAGPRREDRFHYGGGLLALDDGDLLVATGERFAFEKMQSGMPAAQISEDLRGKILRIKLDGPASGENLRSDEDMVEVEVYALGIRNAQGMARSPHGDIWFSEHGPRAGDELNRLRRGGNYGWPQQTCGVYKDRDYQPPKNVGLKLISPVYCWSDRTIAPAGITFYDAPAVPSWRGKLLVAGLSRGSLQLVTLSGGNIVGVESLFEDDPQRLRDVAVAPDGSVYLAVDGANGRVIRLSPKDTTDVAAKARTSDPWSTCLPCHSMSAVRQGELIPLAGLFGRSAGTLAGASSSAALRTSDIIWDEETLDQYLADPTALVPGTTMPVRVEDPRERRIIIEFLRELNTAE